MKTKSEYREELQLRFPQYDISDDKLNTAYLHYLRDLAEQMFSQNLNFLNEDELALVVVWMSSFIKV